jgi:ribosomal protein S18 acetylase RimI-like enzyme
MTEDDVPALVRLHSAVFEGYDSTVMGDSYLKGLYHTLACNTACTSIVALEGSKMLSWIGGVGDWSAFTNALTRHTILRAPVIFFMMLKNRPRLLAKVLTVVWRMFRGYVRPSDRQTASSEGVNASRAAALLVIGVAPESQKQSLGQLMMEDFHRRLISKGFVTSSANTFTDNESGNRAFQKAGYQLSETGNGVNHYIKYLTETGNN